MKALVDSGLTILIVNWNRKDFLRDTLLSLRGQSLPGAEILVVDNGSTDGAPDLVETEFPEVHLVRLPRNIGHCAGLNRGLEIARGSVVVSLDNDAVLREGSIAAILRRFEDRPNLAVLHGRIIDYDGGEEIWWWDWYGFDQATYAEREFATPWKIAEGLCALRRDAVLGVGGFPEEYFIMEGGRDLAIRLIDAGYDIVYAPDVAFLHKSSLQREKTDPFRLHGDRRMYYKLRNELWTLWRNYPARQAITRTLFKTAFWGVVMARQGSVSCYFDAIAHAFRAIPSIARNRRAVRPATIAMVEYSRRRAFKELGEVMAWYFAPSERRIGKNSHTR